LAGEDVVAPTVVKDYDKTNYWSLALLLYALKDWQLGDFDSAGPLFRQFQSVTPEPPYDWIVQYKESIAEKFIDDYTVYRGVSDAMKGGGTLEEQKRALQLLKTARGDLKLSGSLMVKFDEALNKA